MYKDLIRRMYIEEGRTLQGLRDYMQANHSFDATERQYRSRFKRWSYHKKKNRPRPLIKSLKEPEGLGPEKLP
ncbi:hypothetical protein GQ53DRAFT_800769 [Thozetella sp. PMI_491]|nr:hypothetical protein GQ53DRAFT_800769 [Thozetella sp. PMI_491]